MVVGKDATSHRIAVSVNVVNVLLLVGIASVVCLLLFVAAGCLVSYCGRRIGDGRRTDKKGRLTPQRRFV